MPRQAKVIVPGFPHHIVNAVITANQCSSNAGILSTTWQTFRNGSRSMLEVFSYCLMTNHVHLVIQASDNLTAIPQFMKRLAGRQNRFVNALEKRSGSLWEGRYKISPIDNDAYLLACCRYVELNPVKSGMVDKPELYEWSSYSARVGLSHCCWLDEPDTFRALAGSHQLRVEAYRQFVEQEDGSSSDELIGNAINSNKLTGGNKFVDEIENSIGIRVETRKPGRPASKK